MAPVIALVYVMECEVCERTGDPFETAAEALALTSIHDHFHHRGEPTAYVRPERVPSAVEPGPCCAPWAAHPLTAGMLRGGKAVTVAEVAR
ncbi:MAG: hypothetical protein H7Y15_15870 [Pseudonocardia sp.]|nr:hypothetical protein [Pseudonocardia sp.]